MPFDMKPRQVCCPPRPVQRSVIEFTPPPKKEKGPAQTAISKARQKRLERGKNRHRKAKSKGCTPTRRQILSRMGFPDYQTYLRSGLWRSIRAKILTPDAACVLCGGVPNQVHHSRYTDANLRGQSLDDLHPVCGDCHHKAEVSSTGKKRSLADANYILFRR